MSQQRGYILFLTFSMLAACVALVSVFMLKGITHKKLTLALIEQNELSIFAFSTPCLAQSFLAFPAEEVELHDDKNIIDAAADDAKKNKEDKNGTAQEFSKRLLEKILPVVNKTQSFNLKEVDKDLPAAVDLIFFCESGKVNINGLYDFVNKKFYDEGVQGKDLKVFTMWLFDKIAALTEQPSLFGPFVAYLEKRTSPFNDVTELLAVKEFATCFDQAVFYDQEKYDEQASKNKVKIFLTDIFTVSSENDRIQPWLLSPSFCALLDIKIASSKEKEFETENKEDKKIDISSFKVQADWLKDWDVLLKPLYGVTFDKVPESARCMFSKQFAVRVFSVLATVRKQDVNSDNNMKMRIFAILKEKKLPDNSIIYDVIKIYQV